MKGTLGRTDAAAVCLLLLWAGMVLGFAFLVAPLLFHQLPSRDLAGSLAGRIVQRLDWAAWVAFGGSMLLALFPRWIQEIGDGDQPIGPFRLWSAAALAALLMGFASQGIVSPGLARIRARMDAPVESLPMDNPDRLAYQRAHRISRQMMGIRVLLALGLAAGVACLPRRNGDPA